MEWLRRGVLGPVFLAAPLALLALRNREGRKLLLPCALVLLPYIGNIGTRFLISSLPFLSLALALTLEAAAPALLVAADPVPCSDFLAVRHENLQRHLGLVSARHPCSRRHCALRPEETFLKELTWNISGRA